MHLLTTLVYICAVTCASLTTKVWHIHSLEQVTGEQAPQMADMKDGLHSTATVCGKAESGGGASSQFQLVLAALATLRRHRTCKTQKGAVSGLVTSRWQAKVPEGSPLQGTL